MKCPLCLRSNVEKIIFHNGRKFKHYAVTAISYFCLTDFCTHRATILIGNDSKKARSEANILAYERFVKTIETL